MLKKIGLLLFLLVILSGVAFAQTWSKLPGTGVIDVAVANDGTIVFANDKGQLYFSNDVGANWKQAAVAQGVTRVSINSDASLVGVVNNKGELYISRNKGTTWEKTIAQDVVDVSVGRSFSFLVNNKGQVYFSKDFTDWKKAVIENANLVIFGGPFILVSDKAGNVKTADFDGTPAMWYTETGARGVVDIDVAPNGELWIVNEKGEMWTSSDRGKNWKRNDVAKDVIAVSLCDKYLVIANKKGEAYIRK